MPVLLENGFVLIPHGMFADSAVIGGSRCVMSCHASNNKICHADPNGATKFIKMLEECFGKKFHERTSV